MIQPHQTNIEAGKMTYDEQKLDLDPTLIILGLGYATALLVIIGWLATL